MSCNDDIQYWRVIQKYSTIPGQAPTIPPSQDHNDGTWSDTDLYVGELFMNVIDNRIWYRSGDGIHEIGATQGATGSFVGDYVPTAGGTFSGPVYSPTFSAEGIIATLITASAFAGPQIGTSASYIYGDGSNLTGITVAWNGGTVSNPAQFLNDVYLDNFVHINGTVKSDASQILFDTGIEVALGVSASYFIGDGSGLTNLPTGTYSDTYTTAVGLSGSTLIFDRNDMPAAYYVNLAPILSTYSISTLYWNELTSELTLQTEGGDTFTQTINTFDSINVYSDITANNFYGGTFNGTFNGTFSGTIDGDIYTTSATLNGTTIEFDRTNGTSYSVDLSALSGAGGTQSLAQTLAIGNVTGNNDIVITNNGMGATAFGIKTLNNTLDDAKFSFENNGGSSWSPAMRTENGSYTNLVTAGDINSFITSVESGATNTTGQVEVGPKKVNMTVDDFDATSHTKILLDGTLAETFANDGISTESKIKVASDRIDILSDNYITGDGTYIMQIPTQIEVGSLYPSFEGIKYGADYSANFTGLSLVTKDWVQTEIGYGLTDTVGGRTDEVFVDASATSQFRSYNSIMATTASISMDPDNIIMTVGEEPGYESRVAIADEVISIYGGAEDPNNYNQWSMELGIEKRRYNYRDNATPWGTVEKAREEKWTQHWKFSSSSGTPGTLDLWFETFDQEAINDYEVDFYIMNPDTYGPQRTYMTKSFKRRVHYDNYNSAIVLIPEETKKGDHNINPAYDSWDITIQSAGFIGNKYVLDWNLGNSYDFSVTMVVRWTSKKY